VFVESSVPRKSIEAIVAGAATRGQIVEIAGPLYADAMGEPGTEVGTYEGMMRHNFSLIVKALKAGR
jgi:manganese/zinc/iron transport system substrate-binding protein